MLVLGRTMGEAERSEVVLRSRGDGRILGRIIVMSAGKQGRVRLGFEFPDDIVIIRGELEAAAPPTTTVAAAILAEATVVVEVQL